MLVHGLSPVAVGFAGRQRLPWMVWQPVGLSAVVVAVGGLLRVHAPPSIASAVGRVIWMNTSAAAVEPAYDRHVATGVGAGRGVGDSEAWGVVANVPECSSVPETGWGVVSA